MCEIKLDNPHLTQGKRHLNQFPESSFVVSQRLHSDSCITMLDAPIYSSGIVGKTGIFASKK